MEPRVSWKKSAEKLLKKLDRGIFLQYSSTVSIKEKLALVYTARVVLGIRKGEMRWKRYISVCRFLWSRSLRSVCFSSAVVEAEEAYPTRGVTTTIAERMDTRAATTSSAAANGVILAVYWPVIIARDSSRRNGRVCCAWDKTTCEHSRAVEGYPQTNAFKNRRMRLASCPIFLLFF